MGSFKANASPTVLTDLQVDGTTVVVDETNNRVGIGTDAPGTMLQVEGADAYLTLKNTTAENGDGGAETKIIFEDHANASLAVIQASHDGTADDTKGDLIFSTNNGSGLVEAFRVASDKHVTFAGETTFAGPINFDSFSDDLVFASANNVFSYNFWKASAGSGLTVQNNTGGIILDATDIIKGDAKAFTIAPAATSSDNTAGQTISAANLIGGLWSAMNRNASQDDTTDTAANIVAGIPSCAVGDTFEFTFINVSSNSVDLVGGTGVTLLAGSAASFAIAAGKGRRFMFRVTNVSDSSEAAHIFAVTDSFNHSS